MELLRWRSLMTQLKLGEDPEVKKAEIRKKQKEDEEYRKHREAEEAEFNKYFKYGSTQVIKHNGFSYFWGDVSHCGRDSIFHNAREIKKRMQQNGKNYGQMNSNDLPTFKVSLYWDKD